MTDAELLALLDRKGPEQLSLLELERLRTALRESESLRIELLERRQMREYLVEALARIDVSLDSLLSQVERSSSRGGRSRAAAAVIVLLLLMLAGAAIWRPWSEPPLKVADAKNQAAADADEQDPSKSKATDNATDVNRRESATDSAEPASPDLRSSEPEAARREDPNTPAPGPQAERSAPAVPIGPWEAALDPATPPADFYEVCFRPFDTARTTPSKDDLAEWLTPMNAHASIGEQRTSVGNCGAVNGLLRLTPPLTEDAALRFSLEDYDRLKIHAFNGDRGATLIFYQGMNFGWAAYNTTRQPGAAQPDTYVLAGTDGGRNGRTEIRHGGPYELRFRQDRLILSRGDVPIVSAPLEGPPAEVYFDGKAAFLGLAMVKTTPPPFPQPDIAPAGEPLQPAQLDWKLSLADGAEFKKLPGGDVELTADNTERRGFVVAPLPGEGLREIVLQLGDVSPGMAVFLGRGEEGRPFEIVKFLRDQPTGRLCLALHGDDDAFERRFHPVDERMVPFVPERPWLKLLFGCGILRCWLSADGAHWAEPFHDLRSGLPGDVTHLGLHVAAKRPGCRLVLKSVRARPLAAIPSLAGETLLREAPAWPLLDNYGEWLDRAIAAQPFDADADAWRRACAVKTLAAGCSRSLGESLVNALVDDAASRLPV
ncbi:MAG: hypothetical protein KY475_20600, partial [Planctomycetes bacterium]|nr:hypothetical protein [Planctomycetota bacterium]